MKVIFLIPPSKFARNVARDLVYGCWCKGKRIGGIKFPPLSLVSVATVLKEDGLDVELIDAASSGISIKELEEKSLSARFIVMLTSTMTINEDSLILDGLKKANPKLKTIVFGGHVTAEPDLSLSKQGIDIIVRREAEHIMRDLIRAFKDSNDSWKKIEGISFKEKGLVINNPDYPLIEDLDKLPVPDRSLLPSDVDYFNPVIKRMPYTTMFTSRGCPGKCIFCSSPTFYGRAIRFRSAESVLDELEEIKELGYKEVFFRDEIFTISRQRVLDICHGIIDRALDITWICSARIGSVDLDMMRLMKQAGCHMIRFGVETGVQKLLDNIKKGTTLEQITEGFNWAHEVGLDTHAHMMIGLPQESKETLKETMKFIRQIDPTIVTFGIMTPYPGTPLFEDLRQKYPEMSDGTSCDLSKLHTESFFNEYFTQLTNKELSRYIHKVYRQFYIRPSYVLKWLKRINNKDEFKRVVLAGMQVFSFVFSKGGDVGEN